MFSKRRELVTFVLDVVGRRILWTACVGAAMDAVLRFSPIRILRRDARSGSRARAHRAGDDENGDGRGEGEVGAGADFARADDQAAAGVGRRAGDV